MWLFHASLVISWLTYYNTESVLSSSGSITVTSNKSPTTHHDFAETKSKKILILDIDGTVYDNSCHIEDQIKHLIHKYASTVFSCDSETAQALHHKYGSTILGLLSTRTLVGINSRDTIPIDDVRDQPVLLSSILSDYYTFAYSSLDMYRLRGIASLDASAAVNCSLTGYSDDASQRRVRFDASAFTLLQQMAVENFCDIIVASNSPLFHVRRVLCRLGLATLPVKAFVTPDRINGTTKAEVAFWETVLGIYGQNSDSKNGGYHSASGQPLQFLLLDDNAMNLAAAASVGIRGIKISPDLGENSEALGITLKDALLRVVDDIADGDVFTIDDVKYLEAKNAMDCHSISLELFTRLESCLLLRMNQRMQGELSAATSLDDMPVKGPFLNIVELGSGLLNMLESYFLPMAARLSNGSGSKEFATIVGSNVTTIRYVAFESNDAVMRAAQQKLLDKLGFLNVTGVEGETKTRLPVQFYERHFQGPAHGCVSVQVSLVSASFMDKSAVELIRELLPRDSPVDTIVACCLVDLFPPKQLISQLLEISDDAGCLLYAPITFTGETRLALSSQKRSILPSSSSFVNEVNDVLACYDESLKAAGHHVDINAFIDILQDYGGLLLEQPQDSSWNIPCPFMHAIDSSPYKGCGYLFQCMMFFISRGVFPCSSPISSTIACLKQLQKGVLDTLINHGAPSLVLRARNVDILAELPLIRRAVDQISMLSPTALLESNAIPSHIAPTVNTGSTGDSTRPSSSSSSSTSDSLASSLARRRRVMFTGPRQVQVVEDEIAAKAKGCEDVSLEPDQLLLECEVSQISPGTELKIFRGDFDKSQSIDTSFAADECMEFPMPYGYCFVGRVVAVGHTVTGHTGHTGHTGPPQADGEASESLLGKLVFAFAAHGSHAVVRRSEVMLVPEDISPEDACFLPNIETALSLVMSAQILPGERVLVVGQGLVGQLTAAVAQLSHGLLPYGAEPWDSTDQRLIVADVNPQRLAISRSFVPSCKLLNPSSRPSPSLSDADVSIEVSGHFSGLQTAIDHTGSFGRIVLGSWYGENPLPLQLGMRFHRSGLRLIASQVSDVPPHLTGRWSKKRRFDFCWNLIRKIRPARLLEIQSQIQREEGPDSIGYFSLTSPHIQSAYEQLDKGTLLAAIIDNRTRRG